MRRMKKQIENPNKVNWKMYIGIIVPILIFMIIVVRWNDMVNSTVSRVAENLALGALASALVALFIEIGNVSDKNKKSNSIYDAVYTKLKLQIADYVSIWSGMCSTAYKDRNFDLEKHTWLEWYKLAKDNFYACNEDRQKELMGGFRRQLDFRLKALEMVMNQINSQQYILIIHDVLNDEMREILGDFYFEFQGMKCRLELGNNLSIDEFWNLFDATNEDIQKYINNWIDIQFYNYIEFSPYSFESDYFPIKKTG